MSLYPKAAAYLKELAKEQKLFFYYSLEFLEELLSKKTLEDFQNFSRHILFHHKDLFNEWLNEKISEDNLLVYHGIFKNGQHIRYYRDFFNETDEETTTNSKGTLIELKAFGKSTKQDRQVIVFEGRFYNGLLTGFTDKTDSTRDYISEVNSESYWLSPKNDLKTLDDYLTNDCLNVIRKEIIIESLKCNMSLKILERITLHDKSLIVKDVVKMIVRHSLLPEYLEFLTNQNEINFIQNGIIEQIDPSDIYSLRGLADNGTLALFSKSAISNIFTKNKFESRKLPETLMILKEFYDADFIENNITNQIDASDIDLASIRNLSQSGLLSLFRKDFIEQVIARDLHKFHDALEMLKSIVATDEFHYNMANNDYVLPAHKKIIFKNKLEENFKNWPWPDTFTGNLENILSELDRLIAKHYVLNPGFSDPAFSEETIAQIRTHALGNSDQPLLKTMDAIRQTANKRLQEAKNRERGIRTGRFLKKVFIWGSVLYGIYWLYQKSNDRKLFSSGTEYPDADSLRGSLQGATQTIIAATPGEHYVLPDISTGVPLYVDKGRRKKINYRLGNMEKISIDKVEDSMGYFDAYMNDDFRSIPRGWVEMKYLANAKNFLNYPYGVYYRIRSDEKNVPIYRDCLKKTKWKKTLDQMNQIKVFKINGNMAYFRDFYSGSSKISGWVETDRIEKEK